MNLEILLATINQADTSVLDDMNVNTDAIVCNQTSEKTAYTQHTRGNTKIRWYDFQEKGVGLNRNNALMRAGGDICLLADDDVRYFDDYEQTVIGAFEKYPEADVILFNIEGPDGKRRSTETGKAKKTDCSVFFYII